MTQEELNAQLLETVRDGDTVKAEELLNAGAEVNSVNYRGSTPLMRACTYGRMDMVRFLLRKGADPNAINIWGNTALLTAAMYGYTDIVRLFIGIGVDREQKNDMGITSLMHACYYGYMEMTKLLLKYGSDPNAADKYGDSVLMYLCKGEKGRREIIPDLVRAGADLNAKNSVGETPLMQAAFRGDIGIMATLIQIGADVNMTDPKGLTAYDIFKQAWPDRYETWTIALKKMLKIKKLYAEDFHKDKTAYPDYDI